MKDNYRKQHTKSSRGEIQDAIAKSIIDKYTWLATVTGETTGVVGIIPDPWSVPLAIGGASSDIAICMKLQVDMCMCLAENYGYDITSVDAQNLAFLIAGGASLEKAGVKGVTKIGSKAGVKMIQTYLKGTVLTVLKEWFKKIGITFSRKALEKIIPLGVGAVIGAGANYALSLYVGKQAMKWFQIDRKEGNEG